MKNWKGTFIVDSFFTIIFICHENDTTIDNHIWANRVWRKNESWQVRKRCVLHADISPDSKAVSLGNVFISYSTYNTGQI